MLSALHAALPLAAAAYLLLAASSAAVSAPATEMQESRPPPKPAQRSTIHLLYCCGESRAGYHRSHTRRLHMEANDCWPFSASAGTYDRPRHADKYRFSAWSNLPDNVATTVRTHVRKGIHGYRLLLIRCADAEAFAKIQTLKDLRAFKAGQGLGWLDVPIYQDAGLPIMANALFRQLIPMLQASRFDYLPLGIVEAQTILGWCGGSCSDIIIEPTLLIHYPFPIFMHVSNSAPRLLDRLEAGMSLLVATGKFEELWRKHHDPLLAGVTLSNRMIIKLPNKNIPAYTKLDNAALWVDLSNY